MTFLGKVFQPNKIQRGGERNPILLNFSRNRPKFSLLCYCKFLLILKCKIHMPADIRRFFCYWKSVESRQRETVMYWLLEEILICSYLLCYCKPFLVLLCKFKCHTTSPTEVLRLRNSETQRETERLRERDRLSSSPALLISIFSSSTKMDLPWVKVRIAFQCHFFTCFWFWVEYADCIDNCYFFLSRVNYTKRATFSSAFIEF